MRLKQVNLIPREMVRGSILKQAGRAWRRNKKLRRIVLIVLAGFIMVNLLPLIMVGSSRKDAITAKKEVDNIKLEFQKLQTKNFELEKERSELLKDETAYRQQLDFLSTVSSEGKNYSHILKLLGELAPQDLWISRFVLKDSDIQISGSTLDSQLITRFMNELDTSGSFKDSYFISSEKQVFESHTLFNFQIGAKAGWFVEKAKKKTEIEGAAPDKGNNASLSAGGQGLTARDNKAQAPTLRPGELEQ